MPEEEHAPVPVQQRKLAQGPEEEAEESNSGEGEQLTNEEFLRGQRGVRGADVRVLGLTHAVAHGEDEISGLEAARNPSVVVVLGVRCRVGRRGEAELRAGQRGRHRRAELTDQRRQRIAERGVPREVFDVQCEPIEPILRGEAHAPHVGRQPARAPAGIEQGQSLAGDIGDVRRPEDRACTVAVGLTRQPVVVRASKIDNGSDRCGVLSSRFLLLLRKKTQRERLHLPTAESPRADRPCWRSR